MQCKTQDDLGTCSAQRLRQHGAVSTRNRKGRTYSGPHGQPAPVLRRIMRSTVLSALETESVAESVGHMTSTGTSLNSDVCAA
jgi:hypothetical protein